MWLPRSPAHKSLRPTSPDWFPVSNELKKFICNYIGYKGNVYKLGVNDDEPVGHFRHEGKEVVFVKVLPVEFDDQQQQILSMEAWLFGNGVSVIPPLNEKTIIAAGKYSISIHPFLNGRFSSCTCSDLESIGRELAKLHEALNQYPTAEKIIIQNDDKIHLLKKLLEDIKNNKNSKISSYVIDVVTDADPDLLNVFLSGSRQVIHGDLNYGNVIFNKTDIPVIIDFENSLHTYSRATLDLAMIIERFVLNGCQDEAPQLCASLMRGYLSKNGEWFKSVDELKDILQALSLRSLLVLARKKMMRDKIDCKEWDKFVALYKNARKSVEVCDLTV